MRYKAIRLGNFIIEWEEPESSKSKAASKSEDYRTAYCKNCGEPLDSREDEICPDCGWIICPNCGDCGCS